MGEQTQKRRGGAVHVYAQRRLAVADFRPALGHAETMAR